MIQYILSRIVLVGFEQVAFDVRVIVVSVSRQQRGGVRVLLALKASLGHWWVLGE